MSDRLRAHLDRWYPDPMLFAREVLGVKDIWSGMEEMGESVHLNRRTSVAGCHDSGKTFTAAILCWWWVMTRRPSKVITTAPGGRQVGSVLWSEIRKLHDGAKIQLPGRLMRTEWSMDPDWFMLGFSTSADQAGGATKMQGFKSENLLVIFDEAVGIERGIWEATNGIVTKAGCRHLALANPTDPASEFARCARPGSGWNHIRLNALETPNFTGGSNPYTPTLEWVEDMKKYGETSPMYMARVLGQFPDSAIDTLITLSDIERARKRDPKGGKVSLGVDVARFGDDLSVLLVLKGDKIAEVEKYQGQDTVFTAGRVDHYADKYDVPPSRISIDDTGVGGGVTDICRANGMDVNPEDFGRKARDEATFVNRRTELWVWMRDWLKDTAALQSLSPDLIRDLEGDLAGTRYKYRPDQRMALEAKADMKKRLGRSPDVGDALALALAWLTAVVPAYAAADEVLV
jgi:hypothetical protein